MHPSRAPLPPAGASGSLFRVCAVTAERLACADRPEAPRARRLGHRSACGSGKHEGRATLLAPSINRDPVCATCTSGAAAFGRAERALALAARNFAPSAHELQLPFRHAQAQLAPHRTQGVRWHRVGNRREGRPARSGARPHQLAWPVRQARRQSALARPQHRPEPRMRNRQPRRHCFWAR